MKKVAISGGDASGKTESWLRLPDNLRRSIQLVPEVPTGVMTSILPALGREIELSPSLLADYQKVFLAGQKPAEDAWQMVAAANGKKLLWCDRGIPDLVAYTPGGWRTVCQRYGCSKQQIFNRYDYVLLFRSLAAINPQRYLEVMYGNPARTPRTVDEALEVDKKVRDAWQGHPGLIEVDGTLGIEEIVRQVTTCLEEIISSEIERKFLMPNKINATLFPGVVKLEIEQAYLQADEELEERIRQTIFPNGQVECTLTFKTGKGLLRTEWEFPISLPLYQALRLRAVGQVIAKTRYVYQEDDSLYEIDYYLLPKRLLVVEVNFGNSTQAALFQPPSWMNGAQDVTEEPLFKAKSIALNT